MKQFEQKSERTLTHLSLFSGIGGLDLAAEAAGFTTVGQCEWAEFPRKILGRHWPDVPKWRDIRSLTGGEFYEATGLRTVDVISGGFPCQPFSQAGHRRGKDDDRYLWPEMLRVIREIRPAWVLGENVPGIVSLALDEVLADLENEGYEVQTFIIPACGVDAPHRRDRVAIVAHAVHGSESLRRDGFIQDAGGHAEEGPDYGRRETELRSRKRRENKPGTAGMADGIREEVYGAFADADSFKLSRGGEGQILFTKRSSRERERERERRRSGYRSNLHELVEVTPLGTIGRMNPEFCEWLMGYRTGWTESKRSETQ